jgi:proteasome accessory factor C
LQSPAVDVEEALLNKHFTSAYGIFSGQPKHEAVLRFSPQRARWVAKEQWHEQQQSRWLDDGRYELTLPYGNSAELIMDLMKYGADVEVVSPPELRAEIAQRLNDTLAYYQ